MQIESGAGLTALMVCRGDRGIWSPDVLGCENGRVVGRGPWLPPPLRHRRRRLLLRRPLPRRRHHHRRRRRRPSVHCSRAAAVVPLAM